MKGIAVALPQSLFVLTMSFFFPNPELHKDAAFCVKATFSLNRSAG